MLSTKTHYNLTLLSNFMHTRKNNEKNCIVHVIVTSAALEAQFHDNVRGPVDRGQCLLICFSWVYETPKKNGNTIIYHFYYQTNFDKNFCLCLSGSRRSRDDLDTQLGPVAPTPGFWYFWWKCWFIIMVAFGYRRKY